MLFFKRIQKVVGIPWNCKNNDYFVFFKRIQKVVRMPWNCKNNDYFVFFKRIQKVVRMPWNCKKCCKLLFFKRIQKVVRIPWNCKKCKYVAVEFLILVNGELARPRHAWVKGRTWVKGCSGGDDMNKKISTHCHFYIQKVQCVDKSMCR